MKRIGVSQRVDIYPDRGERRDALDQRWADLLWDIGLVTVPLSSLCANKPGYLEILNLDGFILSGGNNIGEAPERDALEHAVLSYAWEREKPVLGVCRGAQYMNVYCGGQLHPVTGHVAQDHPIVGPLANRYMLTTVNSYHAQAILPDVLAPSLTPIAWAEDETIEAMQHRSFPWLGILWHPERISPYSSANIKLISDQFGLTQ